MTAPALELRAIRKRFGAATALDGATIVVRRGRVHALLGENGAGKTTLMRVAFGMARPDAGELLVDGAPARLGGPADAIARGLGMVHQHFTIVPAMTVAENVALGGRGRWRAREAAALVRRVGEESGLPLDPEAPAGELPASGQQRLEIVKALARGARTLILDEPTAVLAPPEVEELTTFLRRFADAGGAVVLITHKLREALAVADDLTVLRRGRTVESGPAAAATPASIARAMLGDAAPPGAPPRLHDRAHDADEPHRTDAARIDPARRQDAIGTTPTPAAPATASAPATPATPAAPIVAEARELVVMDERGHAAVRGVTLALHAGEIVGVAGVEGAGQRELLRALAGRRPAVSGSLAIPPAERIGFVPEDRLRDAVIAEWGMPENVALRGAARGRGRVPWARLRERARALVAAHDVRAPSPTAPLAALSGGNQQKLLLARELEGEPALVVAENPTRGLDIAATAAVHRRLREARDAGAAVLVASSDLDELLALADRALVMFEGRARELPRDREAVGRAMLGLP